MKCHLALTYLWELQKAKEHRSRWSRILVTKACTNHTFMDILLMFITIQYIIKNTGNNTISALELETFMKNI